MTSLFVNCIKPALKLKLIFPLTEHQLSYSKDLIEHKNIKLIKDIA